MEKELGMKKDNEMSLKENELFAAGYQAAKENCPCIPALDYKFYEIIEGCQVGEINFASWNQGFISYRLSEDI